MAHSSRAAHQRVEPPLAQPGAEHDLPSRGQRHRDVLVVAIAMGVKARWSNSVNGCSRSVGSSTGLIQGVRSSRKPCNACWCASTVGQPRVRWSSAATNCMTSAWWGAGASAIVGLPSPVMVASRGYSTPLARTHGVGWTPPSWAAWAGTPPFSAGWPTLYFTHGTALAYRQRPHPPCPVTRHRAPHAGRSGGGRRRREHDTHAISRKATPAWHRHRHRHRPRRAACSPTRCQGGGRSWSVGPMPTTSC